MGNEKYRGKELQCSKSYTSLAVMTCVRLPGKNEKCWHEGNSALRGWRAEAESDETGFGRVRVEGLEAAEDVMGDVSIDDMTECIPKAARAVEFESAGGGGGVKLVKKTKGHLEAEKNFRGRTGEELKEAKRNLAKQSRKYRARRTIQELQEVTNKTEGCHTLYCANEGTTSDMQKWKDEEGEECEHVYTDVYTLPHTGFFSPCYPRTCGLRLKSQLMSQCLCP